MRGTTLELPVQHEKPVALPPLDAGKKRRKRRQRWGLKLPPKPIEPAYVPAPEISPPTGRESLVNAAAESLPDTGTPPRKSRKSNRDRPEPAPELAAKRSSMVREWLDSAPVKPQSLPAQMLLYEARKRTLSFKRLLDFAQAELAEPIGRLVRDYGEMTPLHLVRPQSSFRPPDWRWQLGLKVLTSGKWRMFRRWLRDIKDIVRLQIAICLGEKHDSLLRACGIRADALDALALAFGSQKRGQTGLRLAVDARVLAGCPSEQIAMKLDVPTRAIELYEMAFFDVRGRLTYPDRIISTVIEAQSCPYERELLRLSFAGGIHVAEQLLRSGWDPNGKRPKTPQQVEQFLREDIRATLRWKAALAIRMWDVFKPQNALRFIKLYYWLAHQEHVFESKKPGICMIEAGFKAFNTGLRAIFAQKTPVQEATQALMRKGSELPTPTSDHPVPSQSA